MIYLDALDGEDVIAGRENGWHYGSKFTFEICRQLKKPALMEMSTFHHHLWYVRSRMGAWDHPSRSHKRFIDIHCRTNESCQRMFLPANLGWWSFKAWLGSQNEPTYSDDIEYLCTKALANNASLELSIAPTQIADIPAYARLAAIVKQYETLRRGNYFGDDVKQVLRVAGDDFTLAQNEAGKWQFRRVQLDRHRADRWESGADSWKFTNKYGKQPLQLRIQGLLSAAPYDSPEKIPLADFLDSRHFADIAAAPGVTASLEPDLGQVMTGVMSGRYLAANTSPSPHAKWSKIGRTFTSPVNLTGHEALGLWVYGDGKGEVLNLQLRSPSHLSRGIGDHYIVVDFQGWRYFELIEPEGERHANYVWPYGGSYAIYRESVKYSSVESLNLFYNNLPAKGTARCYLSPIRALPTVKAKLRNPAVSVGGKRIVFPVEIESGCYLEFRSLGRLQALRFQGQVAGRRPPPG